MLSYAESELCHFLIITSFKMWKTGALMKFMTFYKMMMMKMMNILNGIRESKFGTFRLPLFSNCMNFFFQSLTLSKFSFKD